MSLKKRGLSIKYKLLILLTLIPIVALALYTFVAVDLFRKDKMAYVFDSSATVSASLSAQMKAEVNILSSFLRPYLAVYQSSERRFLTSLEKNFAKDQNIQYLAVYHWDNNRFSLGGKLRQKSFRVQNSWIEGQAGRSLVERAGREELVLYPFSKDEVVFLLSNQQDEKRTVVFSVLKNTSIQEIFSEGDSFEKYLVDLSGKPLYGKGEKDFSKWKFFADFKKQSFSSRTIEVVSPKEKEVIISYSKLGLGQLAVVAMVEKDKALVALKLLFTKSLLFFVAIVSASFFISILASQRLTSALRKLLLGTRKVALGDYNVDIAVKSSDEVGQLAQSFNGMATEVSRLMSENVEKARMEKELETAKAVQDALFPATSSAFAGIQVEGYYKSASECGGDWWHYNEQKEQILLWIGDATGHGAPAALITSAAKSVASIVEEMDDIAPSKAMSLLNSSIYKNSKGRICMTFFIGALNKETGEFKYCNASHEPPIKIPHKEDGPIKKMDLEPIMGKSWARLGESPDSEYKDDVIQLNHGDSIYFYTDGVTELFGPDKEMYEERRLLRSLVKGFKRGEGIKGAMEELHESLEEFRQNEPYEDDVTYFMMTYS